MTSKHTPGPWKNGRTMDGEPVWFESSQPPSDWYVQPVNAEHRANMQLVDAAPDMLAALIVAREFISNDRNAYAEANTPPMGKNMARYDVDVLAEYDAALLQVDAAIAKAIGATE